MPDALSGADTVVRCSPPLRTFTNLPVGNTPAVSGSGGGLRSDDEAGLSVLQQLREVLDV